MAQIMYMLLNPIHTQDLLILLILLAYLQRALLAIYWLLVAVELAVGMDKVVAVVLAQLFIMKD